MEKIINRLNGISVDELNDFYLYLAKNKVYLIEFYYNFSKEDYFNFINSWYDYYLKDINEGVKV